MKGKSDCKRTKTGSGSLGFIPFSAFRMSKTYFMLWAEMVLRVLQRGDFPRLYPDFIPPLLSLCTNYLHFLHKVRILFLADTAHTHITPQAFLTPTPFVRLLLGLSSVAQGWYL